MKKAKRVLAVILALAILSGGTYGIVRAVQASRKQPVMVIPAAAVNYGGYWDYESSIEGYITTSATQSVYLSDTEKVDKVLVSAGQAVHEGDVLLTYDATLTQLALEKAELTQQQLQLQLDVAKKNLETLQHMSPYSESDGMDGFDEPELPEPPEEELPDPYENITAVSELDENTLSINEQVGDAGSQGGEEAVFGDDELGEGTESSLGGLGTFENPYRFLVTDGAIIRPSFIAKMKALAEAAGGSLYFTLEIHEGDTYYGATRASWTIDAASLIDPVKIPEEWEGYVGVTGIDVGDEESLQAYLEQEKNEKILSAYRAYLEALGMNADELAESANPAVEAAEFKKKLEDLQAKIEALQAENERLKGTDGRSAAELEAEIAELKAQIAALTGTEVPEPTAVPTETPTEAPTQAPTEAPTQAPTEAPTEAPTATPTDVPAATPTEASDENPEEVPGEGQSAGPQGTVPMTAKVSFDGADASGSTLTYLVSRRPLDGGEAETFRPDLVTTPARAGDADGGFMMTKQDLGYIASDAQYTAEELKEAIRNEQETITMLELDLKEAELGIKAAKKAVEEGVVRAKMNGVVTTAGDPAAPPNDGSAFLEVVGATGLYVRSAISEKMLDSVHEGDSVTVNSWMTGQTLTGEIREISLTPDDSGMFGYGQDVTMYPMTIYISGDDKDLNQGEWVQVTLEPTLGEDELETGEDLFLWKAFIREEGGQKYVYKRGEDGLLVKQEVTVGELNGDGYEILSGVTSADWVAFPYGKDVVEGAETREGSINELYEM